MANTDHTKEQCIDAVANAFQTLEHLVDPTESSGGSQIVPVVAEMAVTDPSCVDVPFGQSDCSSLPATPHLCPTGICCSVFDCSEGCYFGDYTECECAAMNPEMFVCNGLGTSSCVILLYCCLFGLDKTVTSLSLDQPCTRPNRLLTLPLCSFFVCSFFPSFHPSILLSCPFCRFTWRN